MCTGGAFVFGPNNSRLGWIIQHTSALRLQNPPTLGVASRALSKPPRKEIKGDAHATIDLCRHDFACPAGGAWPRRRYVRRSLRARCDPDRRGTGSVLLRRTELLLGRKWLGG